MQVNGSVQAGHNSSEHFKLVQEGIDRIEWVNRHSPVLNGLVRQSVNDGSLNGVRIAVVVHLEAKTAFLASVLAEAGAEVIVAGSNPMTTNGSVVEALRDRGMTVVSEPDGDISSWEQELLAAADHEPEYIVDDGAELTMRIGMHRPELFKKIKGVSEETTTGTARLHAMNDAGLLPFPALTANDARCKHLFDNRYGTGQTTMQAVLNLTNRRIAGARLAVIGYGYVGRGIAEYAKKMGAQVHVVETDPVRALEAHFDGMIVGKSADIVGKCSIVITATGGMRALGQPEFEMLQDHVVLANAGHHDLEVDVETLGRIANSKYQSLPQVTTYKLGTRDVHVLSGGALVNIAGGSGHPVEIMDLTFAVQGLGAHYLVNNKMQPGVHVLPKSIDDSIAAARLSSAGIHLERPRLEQEDDFKEWLKGMQIR